MKLAIMQPYFFPYIGYFQMVKSVDEFVFYDDVQYIQRGWINRNYILSKEGRTLITIPVKKADVNTHINEILIADSAWKEKFANSIKMTYQRAPHFQEINKIIDKVLKIDSNRISDYAIESIKTVAVYLDLSANFTTSSVLEYDRNFDKKNKINSLCDTIGANELILPPGSLELYSKSDFSIHSKFLVPNKEISYKQFSKNRFESNLSMIDVLMFNTKQEVKNLLKEYTFQ